MNELTAHAIRTAISQVRGEIRTIADFIHCHPETAFEEKLAAERLTGFLRQHGFAVTAPAGSLSTSFRAEAGKNRPAVAILAEFDALPQVGHACGHNLIAAAALAAGYAVRQVIAEQQLDGAVIVVGTPGEESTGGKLVMLKDGIFDDIDYALACHPFPATLPDQGALAVSRFDVSFHGEAAHAAAAPQCGRNALDAMNLFFAGIAAWRQQLPEHSRIHGVITSGGNVPNIIPDYTAGYFYVRADNLAVHAAMEARLERIAHGAALMTDTEYKLEKRDNSYQPIVVNRPLNRFFIEQAKNFGLTPDPENRHGMISTDFGDVSQRLPGCNWFFKVCNGNFGLHTEEFRQAAATDFAFDQTMKIAALMAAAAVDLLTDAAFRERVSADFADRQNHG